MAKTIFPKNMSFDQEETAALAHKYRAGIDWGKQLEIEEARINQKFEDKLENARVAGESPRRLSAILKGWNKTLEEEQLVSAVRENAKKLPKPTKAQRYASLDASEQIIVNNEKIVIYFARKRFSSYIGTPHYDDILNAGRMGMFQSLLFYDPSKSAFSTYSEPFILHSMYEFTSFLHGTTAYYQYQARVYKDALAKLMNCGNTAPTVADIAAEMKVGLEAVQKIIGVLSRANPLSLDDEALSNRPIDPLKFSPEEIAASKEFFDDVAAKVAALPEREKLVINLLYDEEKPTKYTTIALEIAKLDNPGVRAEELKPVSTDEVRRLKAKALRTLKLKLSKWYDDGKHSKTRPSSALSINLYPDTATIAEDLDFIHAIDEIDPFDDMSGGSMARCGRKPPDGGKPSGESLPLP